MNKPVVYQGRHYRKFLTLESYLFGNHGNFS